MDKNSEGWRFIKHCESLKEEELLEYLEKLPICESVDPTATFDYGGNLEQWMKDNGYVDGAPWLEYISKL